MCVASVRTSPSADQTSDGAHMVDQGVESLLGDKSFERPHANSVVRRREIEECGSRDRIFQAGQPMAQRSGVVVKQRVQEQRREAELIDHACASSP